MAIRIRRPTAGSPLALRRTMERMLDEPFFARTLFDAAEEQIPLDIYEEDDQLKVKASVPGLKAEDVHVEVDGSHVRIWGETKEDRERRDDDYYLREHHYGRIERRVTLPIAVDADNARADYETGVLTLTLPKAQEPEGHEIEVRDRA